nr:transposase [Candidatus Dependentiae bacterium]
ISNVAMLPRNHVNTYNKRWAIEKFFRTGKQHLGLADCQSRKKTLQEKHIYNVFLAYMILQFERKKNKFKNPERALYHIKQQKNIPLAIHLKRANQIFRNNEASHA